MLSDSPPSRRSRFGRISLRERGSLACPDEASEAWLAQPKLADAQ
jgi:hypothetical protein